MKLLYLSAHSILEYDELRIFEELDIDYFSLGSYVRPTAPADPIRPSLKHTPDETLYSVLPDNKEALRIDFIKKFDVIIIMHVPEWIEKNAEVFKKAKKRVIWRTIGQSTPKTEERMFKYKDLIEIVRYSPKEQNIKNYAGHDVIIRFYKDSNEFRGYTGVDKKVITFSQNMKHRAEFCNYDVFAEVVKDLPAKIFGPKNEDTGELDGGFLTYNDMRQKMRDSRVYFYTGTQPASYTLNFIEAMMTGMPIVALGSKYANSMNIAGDTYEVEDIIINGVNGFISNDKSELRSYIETLLGNTKMCKRIGEMGRQTAIELFGKEQIKEQWKQYLNV